MPITLDSDWSRAEHLIQAEPIRVQLWCWAQMEIFPFFLELLEVPSVILQPLGSLHENEENKLKRLFPMTSLPGITLFGNRVTAYVSN